MCDNSELILGYVYGELPDRARHEFDAHLRTCDACRYEVTELRATRGLLASWAPPEPEFNFRIVRNTPSARAPRRFGFTPAWGLAAAAVLVLAAAAALANVEIRYDSEGLVVRTGWVRDGDARLASAAGQPHVTTVADKGEFQAEIAELQKRLTELEAEAKNQRDGTVQLASGPRMSDAELLRRVRDIVGQSETRQQRETAMQIAQIVKDVDNAQRLNFMRIQQGMGQLRGQTSAEVAQQLNYYLTRVSQQK